MFSDYSSIYRYSCFNPILEFRNAIVVNITKSANLKVDEVFSQEYKQY